MPHSWKQDSIIPKYFFNSINARKMSFKMKEKLLEISCPVSFMGQSLFVSQVASELRNHKHLAISQECPVVFV